MHNYYSSSLQSVSLLIDWGKNVQLQVRNLTVHDKLDEIFVNSQRKDQRLVYFEKIIFP